MKLILAMLATMLLPVLPWIFLGVYWAAKDTKSSAIFILVGIGLLLDIWWGTPLGLTALFLLGATLLWRAIGEWWPADHRVFNMIAAVGSLVLMEVYLALV